MKENKPMRSFLAPLVFASIAFASVGAHAQTLGESLTGSAQANYQAGRILYVDGDFSGAALKFQQAYEQTKEPRLLWNIAAARKGQRQYAEVERLVSQYLKEASSLSADEEAKAQGLLATIDAFIADLTITVDQHGAAVLLDGVNIGTSPLARVLRVDIGDRVVLVEKTGFASHQETLKVTSDVTLTVNLQPVVREGRLRVLSPADSSVLIDGKRVTSGSWEGVLPSGPHSVEVTAPGSIPYRADTLVGNGELSTLRVELESEYVSTPPVTDRSRGSSSAWLWVGAAIIVLGGAAAGGYFVLKGPQDEGPPDPQQGTLGTVELKLGF